jgi:hypothetical protein
MAAGAATAARSRAQVKPASAALASAARRARSGPAAAVCAGAASVPVAAGVASVPVAAGAAGLRQVLDAGGDVDVVAEQVGAVGHDLAVVDADPELQPLGRRQAGIALSQRRLHLDGAAHRRHRVGELGDDAVAGGVGDAAAMLGDARIHDAAGGIQALERALLVAAHERAVAGDVRGQDGRAAAPDEKLGDLRRLVGIHPPALVPPPSRPL